MAFSSAEQAACRKLIDLALAEDLGTTGDLTSQTIIPADLRGQAVFVARADGVVAGLPAAAMTCAAIDSALTFEMLADDGDKVRHGSKLARVAGPMRSLLASERLALNFLQRLSGVATFTAVFVQAIQGLKAWIYDTRKTIPGWRLLEKYAVRAGGGRNHRLGLHDGILIKDNHLAALEGKVDIARVVAIARQFAGDRVPVEVEVESLDELRSVLAERPTMVLLDNMIVQELRASVQMRDSIAPEVVLEASGGITLATVRAIAETGVDRISVGALTHSAPALDIALDYLPA
jgi:nicotinate-nucleotide pyrophosphorylase (carboxylating)